MTDVATADGSDTALSYSYRPSLLGAEWNLTLAPEGFAWSAGVRSGFTRYASVSRLRMAYRPMSMQSTRFMTEIWAPGDPPLRVVSTTWKSMVEQKRLDQEYTRFITELHERVARANGALMCERGRPGFVYWPGLFVFAGVSLGLALLIVRALQARAIAPMLFVAAFFALFVWHGGTFFRRNLPGTYPVSEPPRDLLPG